jgi:hypothetical protein
MMIQEVLGVAADTLVALNDTVTVLTPVADSIAGDIATTVGQQLSALVLLGLGFVIKFTVDLGKKASGAFANAHDLVKALVAIVFGQFTIWLGTTTGILLSPDITLLDTTLSGAVLSAVAMGIHGLIRSVFPPKEQPEVAVE